MKTPCDELSSMDLLNDFGLNWCIMPPMSYIVVISEDGLIRSYKERSEVYYYWY